MNVLGTWTGRRLIVYGAPTTGKSTAAALLWLGGQRIVERDIVRLDFGERDGFKPAHDVISAAMHTMALMQPSAHVFDSGLDWLGKYEVRSCDDVVAIGIVPELAEARLLTRDPQRAADVEKFRRWADRSTSIVRMFQDKGYQGHIITRADDNVTSILVRLGLAFWKHSNEADQHLKALRLVDTSEVVK